MSGGDHHYPPHLLDEIRARTNIEQLVAKRVKLATKGRVFWGLCPFHEEKSPSFKVENARRTYHCFGCGAGGDAFEWLTQTEGMTFPEAVQKLAGEAGIDLHVPAATQSKAEESPAPSPPPEKPRGLSPEAMKFWQSCRPITPQSTGGSYLTGRHCAIPPEDGDLREHPDVYNWVHKSRWPALVGLITDAITNTPISLHVTFLAPDGGGKAPIDPPRLYLARHEKAGGVVRLWPDAHVTHGLLIAEGIETALSAARAFTPVWSCLDAGNLGEFPVLPGIEALTICEDDDDAGRRAAAACADRWAAAGRDVRILRAS